MAEENDETGAATARAELLKLCGALGIPPLRFNELVARITGRSWPRRSVARWIDGESPITPPVHALIRILAGKPELVAEFEPLNRQPVPGSGRPRTKPVWTPDDIHA